MSRSLRRHASVLLSGIAGVVKPKHRGRSGGSPTVTDLAHAIGGGSSSPSSSFDDSDDDQNIAPTKSGAPPKLANEEHVVIKIGDGDDYDDDDDDNNNNDREAPPEIEVGQAVDAAKAVSMKSKELVLVAKKKTMYTAIAVFFAATAIVIGLLLLVWWYVDYASHENGVPRWTVENVPIITAALLFIGGGIWAMVWLIPYIIWFCVYWSILSS
mgnify:FL=1